MRDTETKMENAGGDIESGNTNSKELYPGMMENAKHRWAFIRKVYSILALQFLLTVAVAAVAIFVKPSIPHFFLQSGWPGIVVWIVVLTLPLIMMCPLYALQNHYPWNMIFLILFTMTISILVGLSCAFTSGKIILEAAILTSVMVLSLTLYTFWGVKRGQDFSFLGPFLFASLLMLIVFALIQIVFPLGDLLHMIYGCLAAIIFCGYILYDTGNLIKRFTYDEYVVAAIALYLDVINLFLSLLTVFSVAD